MVLGRCFLLLGLPRILGLGVLQGCSHQRFSSIDISRCPLVLLDCRKDLASDSNTTFNSVCLLFSHRSVQCTLDQICFVRDVFKRSCTNFLSAVFCFSSFTDASSVPWMITFLCRWSRSFSSFFSSIFATLISVDISFCVVSFRASESNLIFRLD